MTAVAFVALAERLLIQEVEVAFWPYELRRWLARRHLNQALSGNAAIEPTPSNVTNRHDLINAPHEAAVEVRHRARTKIGAADTALPPGGEEP